GCGRWRGGGGGWGGGGGGGPAGDRGAARTGRSGVAAAVAALAAASGPELRWQPPASSAETQAIAIVVRGTHPCAVMAASLDRCQRRAAAAPPRAGRPPERCSTRPSCR